jgi:threonine synthase
MPAQSPPVLTHCLGLACRVCATEHPLEANGTCTRCFGPLDPVYDWEALRATVTRERIADGPLSLWRYADLLPVSAPEAPRQSPGWPRRSASASSG